MTNTKSSLFHSGTTADQTDERSEIPRVKTLNELFIQQ